MPLDLAKKQWQLAGWRPNAWMLRPSVEPVGIHAPEVGPVPAIIPASVQHNLLRAGIIEDWNVGLNSSACEWVEHRHWEFFTHLDAIPAGKSVRLEAEGLDHSGWILIDLKIVATFEGALKRHRVDLTEAIADGKPH